MNIEENDTAILTHSIPHFDMDLNHMRQLLDDVETYVYTKDRNGCYTYANKMLQTLFEQPLEAIIGCDDSPFFGQPQLTRILENDRKVLSSGKPLSTDETCYVTSLGEIRIYRAVKKPIFNSQKQVIGLFGMATDITDIFIAKEQLKRQASIDELSGLYNRRYFFNMAEIEFSKAVRHATPCSLMILDIDFFKKINDQYGHPTGDVAIELLGKLLLKQSRKEDILARIGGEEFAMLLPNTGIASTSKVAEKIRLSIAETTIVCDLVTEFNLTVSIGATSIQISDNIFSELYQRADRALYEAKNEGRNRASFA